MSDANIVIDLSHHNERVDFRLAKDEIRAVFHKATQGLSYVDPTFAARRAAAKASGLLFGSYHFGTNASGIEQAQNLLNAVGEHEGELLVLDIEQVYDERGREVASMTLDQAADFVTEIRNRTGLLPGIYGGSYLKDLLGKKRHPVLSNCWFWLAQYVKESEPTWTNPTWSTYTFWQYTDGKRGNSPHEVAGIGPCDRDIFNGSAEQLEAFWTAATRAAPGEVAGLGVKSEFDVSFGWLPDLPDHRDRPYGALRLSLEQPTEMPKHVDLRTDCPAIYDQGTLGSCTANAIAGAFEFDRIKQSLPDFMPSRLFIYYNERAIEGYVNQDRGAYLRDGIKSIVQKGVCREDDWPYDVAKFAVTPSDACYTSARKYVAIDYFRLDNQNLGELKSCLAAGFPFVFGFTVYPSFFQADSNGGIVPMPGNEAIAGGHAVMAVGYDDITGRFIIRNSWGLYKGAGGYYYMPYQYLTSSNLASDFWTIRMVSPVALAPVPTSPA
jgi:GH25 family lysozyme M1 (1,4-beta-N-acetylmuramidase)